MTHCFTTDDLHCNKKLIACSWAMLLAVYFEKLSHEARYFVHQQKGKFDLGNCAHGLFISGNPRGASTK